MRDNIKVLIIVFGLLLGTVVFSAFSMRQSNRDNYDLACNYIKAENYEKAIESLKQCGNYENSEELLEELTRTLVVRDILSLSEVTEDNISSILERYHLEKR